MKLSKKTNDIISFKVALKETKNVCKKVTQIFNILSEDYSTISQLFSSFIQSLSQFLANISELIIEMDFSKDFQFNHTIWQIINTIRKTLMTLKTEDES